MILTGDIAEIAVEKNRYYKTIYLDPPWPEVGGGKIKRGADKHYPLMKLHEISELPIYNLAAENCHLYLWTTNKFLADALSLVEGWGFNYKTCITWMKDRFGLGQYYRGQTEHCLFAVKGVLPYRTRPDGKRAQGRTAIYAKRTIHSLKPHEMRQMIELVSHEPRIELFARQNFEGWDVWGLDVSHEQHEGILKL